MYSEFLLKYKKHIILVLCFLVIFTIIYGISNTNGSKRKKIIKAITYSGFTLDDSKLLYEKDIDDKTYEDYKKASANGEKTTYKHLYFDPKTYELIENYLEYDSGTEAVLTAIYDYKHEKLKYTYSIWLEELELTYSGKLSDEGFTCKVKHTLNAGTSNKEDFCFEIEKLVRDFDKERLSTITSSKILNYMKEEK